MFLINFHVVYRFTEITIDNKRIYYFKPLDYFERNIREVKQKKLERLKRCADGHENDDFDTTTASMLKISFDSKGYGVKKVLCSRFGLLSLPNIHIIQKC